MISNFNSTNHTKKSCYIEVMKKTLEKLIQLLDGDILKEWDLKQSYVQFNGKLIY